ncbi:MAG: nitroreductase family protein [Candidatus Nanohalobium sp.]
MSAFENILNLSSFRHPEDETLPRPVVGKILEAGRNTPSPGNVQTLEFIVVEDDHKLEMLSQALGDHRIAEAPLSVLVVVDESRMKRKVGSRSEEFCMMEAATSVQNMRVVAQEEGISSMWRTGFDRDTVSDQFDVPGGKDAVAVVSFAYTDNPIRSEPRFGMNEVVFYDEYGNQIKSHFDGLHWKGLNKEKRVYGKKVEGFITRIRRKIREVL